MEFREQREWKLLEQILHELRRSNEVLHDIRYLLYEERGFAQKVVKIQVKFGDGMNPNAGTGNIGDVLVPTVQPIDAAGTVVAGATLSNVSYTVNDPTVAEVTTAADGVSPAFKLVKTGTTTGNVSATVQDANQATANGFQGSFTLTVAAPVDGDPTAGLQVTFALDTPPAAPAS